MRYSDNKLEIYIESAILALFTTIGYLLLIVKRIDHDVDLNNFNYLQDSINFLSIATCLQIGIPAYFKLIITVYRIRWILIVYIVICLILTLILNSGIIWIIKQYVGNQALKRQIFNITMIILVVSQYMCYQNDLYSLKNIRFLEEIECPNVNLTKQIEFKKFEYLEEKYEFANLQMNNSQGNKINVFVCQSSFYNSTFRPNMLKFYDKIDIGDGKEYIKFPSWTCNFKHNKNKKCQILSIKEDFKILTFEYVKIPLIYWFLFASLVTNTLMMLAYIFVSVLIYYDNFMITCDFCTYNFNCGGECQEEQCNCYACHPELWQSSRHSNQYLHYIIFGPFCIILFVYDIIDIVLLRKFKFFQKMKKKYNWEMMNLQEKKNL